MSFRSRSNGLLQWTGDLLRPSHLRVNARKVANRLRRQHRSEAQDWAAGHAESVEDFGNEVAADLWEETVAWAKAQKEDIRARRPSDPYPMGGPGDYKLVYFLMRHLKPRVTIETGVAAGWTSQAILSAIEQNGFGRCYSSDLPYSTDPDAISQIGRAVEEHLRGDWRLAVRGDRVNLAEFLSEITSLDFVHYDSDKSYAGRKWAMEKLSLPLSPSAVVVMDDIGDDTFFRDWTAARGGPFRVFHRGGPYYVGLVGL